MPVQEMICQELVEVVTDYLEDALDSADRDRFEQHLVLCDGCARHLEQMRTTVALTGALTDESIPAEVQDRLLTVFRGWRRG